HQTRKHHQTDHHQQSSELPTFIVFPVHLALIVSKRLFSGNVEKTHQRRSRHFEVLTYSMYAPRVKMAAALLDELF
ncbi:MAG: hypothetical protein ACE1ZO_02915, partial [Nitrospirales bacterium]